MKSRYLILAVLAAVTLVASACAPQAAPTVAAPTQPPAAKAAPSAAAPQATPSGPAMISLATGTLGPHLVDNKGMTLYLLTKDSPGTSTCYDKCAAAWPALLTAGAPQAASGLDAAKLGTTTRTDGTMQVTYNGWPLYYFAKDKQAGDTTGEGVGGVWFCIAATGDAIKP